MTIISCYDTLMLTDSSVSAMLSNLRNYSDREVPKTPEIEALRKLDREATFDRSWWQKFFNPTKEELLEQIAEPTFVEKLIFNHPELVLGPASLGLSGLKTAGALALQRVAPRVLALGSVAPLWENLVNYMKVGKDAVKKPVNSSPTTRAGTTGYKTGKSWDSLKPVNSPEMQREIGKINKQAFGGGEMRTDGEYVFRFDPAHQTGKIHMEMYKKVAKGWQPYAECDPQTGNILEGSLKEMAKRQ